MVLEEGLLGFTIDCYISMKMINGWSSRSKLNTYITDPSILADSDSLYYSFYNYNFHTYNAGGPARFYHRLVGVALYSILDEDNYFDEDD
jgi:hypothetical protein